MNKKDLTSAKFQICSGATTKMIQNWEDSDEKSISEKWGIDLKKFYTILDSRNLESYYTLLLGYLSGQKYLLSHIRKINPKTEKKMDVFIKRQNDLFELAKMLRFLLDDSKGRINYLKINKEKADSVETMNDRVLTSIQESLTERIERDYRELNGHIDMLTDEEATIHLKDGQDPDWLLYWNNFNIYTDQDEKRLIPISLDIDDDIVLKYVDTNDFTTGAEAKRLLINDYAFDHEIERPLTQEYLNKVIEKYAPPKKTKGGQEKHFQAKRIMQVLTNVFWTEYFFFEKISGKTSCPVKITNYHYSFFYKVFVAWGLFDDFQISIPEDYGVEKKLRDLFSPGPGIFWPELSPSLRDLKSRIKHQTSPTPSKNN